MAVNALINEESPYLQQHAQNPVAWLPWNDANLQKAKEEEKLIFLSIGYSTCHWCHVMEHESFEDEEVAQVLNRHFVSIKVDKEEMPHVDKYFQDMHAMINRRGGGWPLSVVLTPSLSPVFIGTYVPKEPRYNMPGFIKLLEQILEHHSLQEEAVESQGAEITRLLSKVGGFEQDYESIDENLATIYVRALEANFDFVHKGIGKAPKFPHATTFSTLLDVHELTKDEIALSFVEQSLQALSFGGINDQIEGGFYRYSVDEAWQVPHFEKMLYTNAELLELFSRAYRFTKEPLYKKTALSIIAAMKERFLHEGLFFSASDADSVGKEGAYFVFNYEQSLTHLLQEGFTQEEALAVVTYLHITPEGNFEDNTTNPYCSTKQEAPKVLEHAKKSLATLRQKQYDYPFIDYKLQTSWNALFLAGLFEASSFDESLGDFALSCLDVLLEKHYKNALLYHQSIINRPAIVEGYLEDYSFLIKALLAAYAFSFKEHYLKLATTLCRDAVKRFYKEGRWVLSANGLQTRAPLEDASYASAAATMAFNLFTLALYESELSFYDLGIELLSRGAQKVMEYPIAYALLVKAILLEREGFILIKAKKEQLQRLQKQLFKKNIFFKVSDSDKFLLCNQNSCFKECETLEEVLEVIKE